MSPAPTPGRGRLAVLLSGSGTTLARLLDAIDAGELSADVVVAGADRTGARGLERAAARGIPTVLVDRRPARREYGVELAAAVDPFAPDWIVLAGFLTCFALPAHWTDRVVNVHPSLLPAFGGRGCYGLHVHRAVLARGCRVTGCTVHVVTNDVDGGPILDQEAVRVHDDDDAERLAARVQAAERRLYPRVLDDLVRGRYRRDGEGRWIRA